MMNGGWINDGVVLDGWMMDVGLDNQMDEWADRRWMDDRVMDGRTDDRCMSGWM